MSKNNLYTKSYFKKRIKSKGFCVLKTIIPKDNFSNIYWTMIIERNKKIITINCNRILRKTIFELKIKDNNTIKISTQSMEVMIERLMKLTEKGK